MKTQPDSTQSRKDAETAKPDNSKIRFSVRTRKCEYGDHRKFWEWQIILRESNRVVQILAGPRRQFNRRQRRACRADAWQRVRELRAQPLFIIDITQKHIQDGEGHSCSNCAISRALYHNQERMGLPKDDFSFEVDPYDAWMDPQGIVMSPKYGNDQKEKTLPATQLPDVVWNFKRGGKPTFVADHMVHFAMNFDDYKDSQDMSLADWRHRHGYTDGERPYNPGACTFVLNLNDFKPVPPS